MSLLETRNSFRWKLDSVYGLKINKTGGPVWYQGVTMRGASRTDATGQRGVHVDDGGGLRAGDAEPRELVAEQQPELL